MTSAGKQHPVPRAGVPSSAPRAGAAAGAAEILALVGAVFLIGAVTITKLSNNDIWIHLRTGQQILHTGHLPGNDPYSFTAPDHPYVVHEWLSQVVFYLVYAAAGINGLILFKFALVLVTCAALAGVCQLLSVRTALVYPCLALMLFVAAARFLERPHVFSFLFLALYLLCYFGFRERGRKRIWLTLIPVLDVVWTNLHGGYVQGIALLLIIAVAESAALLRSRWMGGVRSIGHAVSNSAGEEDAVAQRHAERGERADVLSPRDLALVAALPFACVAASLINPLGYKLLLFPFQVPNQEFFLTTIFEWKPLLHPQITHTATYLFFVIWTALLLGSILIAARGSGRHDRMRTAEGRVSSRTWSLATGAISLVFWGAAITRLASSYKAETAPQNAGREILIWAAAGLLVTLLNFRRLELLHAGIAALFFALAVRSNRSTADAAIVTMPSLAHGLDVALDRLRERLGKMPDWLRPATFATTGAAMFVVGFFTIRNGFPLSFDPPVKREQGFGVASTVPLQSVDYVARNHITGNCFSSYEFAGLLIFRSWPDVKVAMDSRNDVYGEQLSAEWAGALQGGPALEAYLRKWPVDFFVLNYNLAVAPELHRTLIASGAWKLVYFDDFAVIYLKDSPRFAPIIARDAYTLLNPALPDTPPTRADADQRMAEADRAIAAAPGAWRPLHFRARLLIALGRYPEAEAIEERIVNEHPEVYAAWADLGNLYLLASRNANAAGAFARCIALCPDCTPCRSGLSIAKSRAPG